MEEELKTEIESLLKSLRKADTQADAIKWMTRAYKAMEACLEADKAPKFFIVPDRPKLEIVQSIPQRQRYPLWANSRPDNKTHVYPDIYLPPGLKQLPKPWTREDTRRLERAAADPIKRLVKLGK